MSSTFPIIVYGNGDLFSEYFNAIVAAFGKGSAGGQFSTLLHISILLAGFTVIYSFILRRDLLVMMKWLGIFYFAIYVMFIPESTVIITDRVNGNATYAVDHVPRGLAVLASYTSIIGDALTRNLESNFTMPDYQPYHKTGMVFASRLVEATTQFEITDARFDANLKEFIHQCVFYDLLLRKYSINEFVSNPNIWSFISSNASPARAFIYDDQITTCKDGVSKLNSDWSRIIDSTAQTYGKRLFPNLTQKKAKTEFLSKLPISYQYLTNLSETASNILQQNLMANAIQRGVVSLGAKLNAPAALESYAFARAQEQKRLTNKTLGDMAAYWLPLMKNAFEAIMYGSFIFIVLLSVFPFGWVIIKNYVYTLLWIQIWAPLYAIINLIVSYYAQLNTHAAVEGGITLTTLSGVLQVNSDISGLAGYLTLSVPFLSAGLVKGMAGTFTQLAQYVGGVTQSAGGTAAAEAATGNFNFGNTSLNNHSAFNTTANHLDTSGRVSAGFFSTQMAGGSILTMTADGTVVMDSRGSISSLGASVQLGQSVRTSYVNQAEKAITAAKSDSLNYSHSTNSAIKDMYEIGSHLNRGYAQGDSWTMSENGAVGEAINENMRLTREFAERHHMDYSEAANVLANAHVSGQLGGQFGPFGGASAGGSRSASHNSATSKGGVYSDAENYVKDTNYSKNVDKVFRAAKDHSFRINNDEGSRLVTHMSTSLDKADSYRHDMQSHLSEADSARKSASLAADKSASININASQDFFEWWANQPGTDGKGTLGYAGVESMKNDPVMMRHYADQYVEKYRDNIMKNWNQGLQTTEQGIKNKFHENNHDIKTSATVTANFNKAKTNITERAAKEGLSGHVVNTSVVAQTEKSLFDDKAIIDEKNTTLSNQGVAHESHVKAEEKRTRNDNLAKDMATDIDTKDY